MLSYCCNIPFKNNRWQDALKTGVMNTDCMTHITILGYDWMFPRFRRVERILEKYKFL